MDSIRVLVTGAGSGVGQGIMKSLKISGLPLTVIAADISPMNAGLFRAEEALLIPPVEKSGSLEKIIEMLRQKKIDILMVGSEFDLRFFAEHKEKIESASGTLIIVSSVETVRIADDKFETAEFLRKNKLPYAESFMPKTFEEAVQKIHEWGVPVILKPCQGTSARHVHILHAEDDLKKFFSGVPRPLLQKLIEFPKDSLSREYTCSVFKCSDGSLLGPFTARRVLKGGHSWVVEVDSFETLCPLMLEIGRRLEITGSLNVQLMLGKNGPVPFEFNARFSGTTAVRAHFGFNEPEMAIRHYFLKQRLNPPKIGRGLAFRYPEEVFVDGVSAAEMTEPLPKGVVQPWF